MLRRLGIPCLVCRKLSQESCLGRGGLRDSPEPGIYLYDCIWCISWCPVQASAQPTLQAYRVPQPLRKTCAIFSFLALACGILTPSPHREYSHGTLSITLHSVPGTPGHRGLAAGGPGAREVGAPVPGATATSPLPLSVSLPIGDMTCELLLPLLPTTRPPVPSPSSPHRHRAPCPRPLTSVIVAI